MACFFYNVAFANDVRCSGESRRADGSTSRSAIDPSRTLLSLAGTLSPSGDEYSGLGVNAGGRTEMAIGGPDSMASCHRIRALTLQLTGFKAMMRSLIGEPSPISRLWKWNPGSMKE
jgi:hypothetical protein